LAKFDKFSGDVEPQLAFDPAGMISIFFIRPARQ
jgi:hypothetical protein